MKIFISHIREEAIIAIALKDWIESTFAGQYSVFVSSDNDSIRAGQNWFWEIEEALKRSKVLVTICSPVSILRPWINFETGAAWVKKIPIIPICHSDLKVKDLPFPISLFQALELEDDQFPKLLISSLAKEIGIGKLPRISFEEMHKELISSASEIKLSIPMPQGLYEIEKTNSEYVDDKLISLGGGFEKDNRHVYYEGQVIKDADATSFRYMRGSVGKDIKNIFYAGNTVNGADPKSFKIINEVYSHDNECVYFFDKIIFGADPNTFENIDCYWSRDKMNMYFKDQKESVVKDPSTIAKLDYPFWIDSRSIYMEYIIDSKDFLMGFKCIHNIDTENPISSKYRSIGGWHVIIVNNVGYIFTSEYKYVNGDGTSFHQIKDHYYSRKGDNKYVYPKSLVPPYNEGGSSFEEFTSNTVSGFTGFSDGTYVYRDTYLGPDIFREIKQILE